MYKPFCSLHLITCKHFEKTQSMQDQQIEIFFLFKKPNS